jgi:hypothetical protein
MESNSHISDGWSKAKKVVARKVRRFLLMFLYLWALFLLLALNEEIVLRQRGISFSTQSFGFINALVLAKVMLMAEDLDLGRWRQRRPLIYPILYESLLLTALFICFHVVEHVAIGLFKGESLAASVPHIGGGGLVGLACVAVILFVTLIPFFAFKHVSRELGEARLRAMLFGANGSVPDGR